MSRAETSALIKTIARTAVLLVSKSVEETTKDYLDDIDDIIDDIPADPEPTPDSDDTNPPADGE